MKQEHPLTKIHEVQRMLGKPRVDMTVLWTVVTQLASDVMYLLAREADLTSENRELRTYLKHLNGPDWPLKVAPVGGSDSAEPSSETEWSEPCLFDG